jgi:hypothetical protein
MQAAVSHLERLDAEEEQQRGGAVLAQRERGGQAVREAREQAAQRDADARHQGQRGDGARHHDGAPAPHGQQRGNEERLVAYLRYKDEAKRGREALRCTASNTRAECALALQRAPTWPACQRAPG